MAIQTVKYGFPFPAWPMTSSLAPSIANILIDADAEKVALIFAASAAKSIRKIHFRLGTTTTGATVDARVETVDTATTGDPTGVLWDTNTNGAAVVANGDDNVWKTATLTADALLAVGDVVALVIANGTGGVMNLRGFNDQGGAFFPYGDHFTAAWAHIAQPVMIVPEYSDGSFEPIFGYVDNGDPMNASTFKSDDATNRRGNLFQLPFPARAVGAWAWVDADGPFTIKLYDSDGTSVLASTATITSVQRQANNPGIQSYPFLASATLSANTTYYLAIVPSTTTTLIAYDFDVATAAMMDLFPGGQACHRAVFTSSAWVPTTTSRGYLGVFLDGFSDGVGGGSGGGIIGDGASW